MVVEEPVQKKVQPKPEKKVEKKKEVKKAEPPVEPKSKKISKTKEEHRPARKESPDQMVIDVRRTRSARTIEQPQPKKAQTPGRLESKASKSRDIKPSKEAKKPLTPAIPELKISKRESKPSLKLIERIQNEVEHKPRKVPDIHKHKEKAPKEADDSILDMTIGLQTSRTTAKVDKKATFKPVKEEPKHPKKELGLKQTPSALRSKAKEVVAVNPEVKPEPKLKISSQVSKSKQAPPKNPLGFGFFDEDSSEVENKKLHRGRKEVE